MACRRIVWQMPGGNRPQPAWHSNLKLGPAGFGVSGAAAACPLAEGRTGRTISGTADKYMVTIEVSFFLGRFRRR
jgi:hypothetical protein